MVSWCRTFVVGGLLGLSGVTRICHADEWDTFNLHVGVGHEYDSNIFRLPDGERPNVDGETSRSDQITSLTAGANIDKQYSLQRFKLNGEFVRNSYANYDFLDHTDKNYLAEWDWSFTPRLSGVLSSEQKQALTDAAYFRDASTREQRNIRTTRSQRFDADWWMHSNWHLLGGAGIDRRKFETDFEDAEQGRSFRATRLETGLRFDTGAGRTLTATARQRDGEYDDDRLNLDPSDPRDNGFKETEYELALAYTIGDSSRLRARLAHIDHSEDHINVRDFSGWTGDAHADWGLTAKTRLSLSYSSDLAPWQDESASYARLKVWGAGLSWDYSEKQNFELRLEHRDRDHRGALDEGAEGPLREDRTRSAGLYWTWKPTLTTEVAGHATYDRRNSNDNTFDYDAYALGLSVSQTF